MDPTNLSQPKTEASTLKYIGTAVVIAVLLIIAKFGIEHVGWTHRIEALAFEFLQGQMLQFSCAERLPVLVIDLSDIPGGKHKITPRKPLRDFIQAIVRYSPRAIAIDVDFSPGEDGWKDDNDPDFFDFCLEASKKVPIVLGVHRTREASAGTWLGVAKYKEMAGDMTLPVEVVTVPVRASKSKELPTLGAALAHAYTKSKRLPGPLPGLGFFVKDRDEATLVNYSKLYQLKHETLPLKSYLPDIGARFFRDKMVIIGDAGESTETRNVPGHLETIPGVYVHACAAHTLAIEPLFELTPRSRFWVDVVIALVIILIVARYRNIRDEQYSEKLRFKVIVRAIAVVIVVGVLFVRYAGVMWLDFFLVIFALLLHHPAERWLTDLRDRLKQWLTDLWDRVKQWFTDLRDRVKQWRKI